MNNLTIKKSGSTTATSLQVPDDYRMDELFCSLKGIKSHVPHSEVQKMMAESGDELSTQNGNRISFRDYANTPTTLKELGIGGEKEYVHTENGLSTGQSGHE